MKPITPQKFTETAARLTQAHKEDPRLLSAAQIALMVRTLQSLGYPVEMLQ